MTNTALQPRTRTGAGNFPIVLGLIFVFFIGVLVAAWVIADKAAPVMLDEKGHVR